MIPEPWEISLGQRGFSQGGSSCFGISATCPFFPKVNDEKEGAESPWGHHLFVWLSSVLFCFTVTSSCSDFGIFSLEFTPHLSSFGRRWVEGYSFLYSLSYFFSKAESITVNNLFILMVLEAFSTTPRRSEKWFKKRKGEKKILSSCHDCLFCYNTFLVLWCCKDNAMDQCRNEDALNINKTDLFFQVGVFRYF